MLQSLPYALLGVFQECANIPLSHVSNNSYTGSVQKVLTGKFETSPKEVFTSKRPDLRGIGGVLGAERKQFKCVTPYLMKTYAASKQRRAAAAFGDSFELPPKTVVGLETGCRFKPRVKVRAYFEIQQKLLKQLRNANRWKVLLCVLCSVFA